MKNFTISIILMLAFTILTQAQIPNNGFENWITTGNFEEPTGWATMNAACAGPFYSCTKSTDHYPTSVGSYSIRVENNTSLTQMTGGYGMVITDTMAYPFQPAFPISGHPLKLCGYYKYNAFNNDTMFIKILVFNNGVMIFDEDTTAANTSEWSPFSITFPSYTTADSATIIFSAFYPSNQLDGPNGNSVLYVDNLSFDNLISSVSETTAENKFFTLYPNPALDFVSLNINIEKEDYHSLNIYNTIGQIVRTETILENNQQINIADLSNGIYIFEIKSKTLSAKQKLVIQR